MSAGAVNISLGATIGSFLSGISQARQAVGQLASDINTRLVTSYANADRQSQVFERGLGRLGTGLQDIGGKLSAFVTAPILGVGAAAFKTYADVNALLLGLENITGSAQGAKARFEELKEVAKLPGLGLEEAVQGDVRLQAIGFSAKTSKDALLQFGNALALTGGGKFELNSVITQLSQMGSKSKVLAEDLKPILNASPAVAKAIRQMFGTVDSESISKQLTKAGKGPGDFIKDLIEQLSKLERVKGGPKNAIENFGDAVKLAAFNIGEAADKSFNITGIFNKIGDTIGELAQRFAGLPEGVQKAIFGVAGFAAAMGPAALAIGSIIKLIPILKLGFSALGGPIAIAVAVIVTAAALIIANWDKIKVYYESLKKALIDSGIWDTLKQLVTSSIEAITAVFNSGVTFLVTAWDSLKGYLIPVAKFIFGTIGEIFKVGAGLLTGTFKVLTGILTGDWSKLKEGLQNITASIWNGIIGITANSIVYVGSLFAAFVEQVGATDFAASLRNGLDNVSKAADKMKISLQGAKDAVPDATVLPEVTVLGKRPEGVDLLGGAAAGGTGSKKKPDSFVERVRKDLAAVESLIKEFESKNPGKTDPSLLFLKRQKGYYQDQLKIDDKTDLPSSTDIGPVQTAGQRYWKAVANGWFTPLQRQFAEIKTDVPRFFQSVQASIASSIDSDRLTQKIKNIVPTDQLVEGLANLAVITRNGKAAFDKAQNELFDLPPEKRGQVLQNWTDMAQGIRASLEGVAESIAVGFGEVVGGVLSGAGGLSDLPNMILGIIGDTAIQLGKLAIGIGISIEAIKTAFKSLGGVGAVAAGIALIALGTYAKSSVSKIGSSLPKFANGNVAYRPTVAMFGEYAGASYNPEITTPEKKMREVFRTEMANYGGGGGGGDMRVLVRGEDLLLIQERAMKSRNERR